MVESRPNRRDFFVPKRQFPFRYLCRKSKGKTEATHTYVKGRWEGKTETKLKATVVTARHNRSLTKQVTAQSTIIDSLLARRMELIDVQLYVTDKSKNVIYGKYNKGHIYMPQKRKYILEIDSTSVMVK